jgi:hypothetical protein
VLEKIPLTEEDKNQQTDCHQRLDRYDLLDLWQPCGLSNSFQSIINSSGWEEVDCPECHGDGFTSEHDPNDMRPEHIQDGDCRTCPVQVQCEWCEAEGKIEQLANPQARELNDFLISTFNIKYMEHEKQLVNRELAQEMKELGFEQESQFYWVHHRAFTFEQKPKLVKGWNLVPLERMRPHHDSVYSAYSVAELGEMLYRAKFYVATHRSIHDDVPHMKWECNYDMQKIIHADTEANCRAKMLIYLRKNNLI